VARRQEEWIIVEHAGVEVDVASIGCPLQTLNRLPYRCAARRGGGGAKGQVKGWVVDRMKGRMKVEREGNRGI
jgi:hypothetical protein